MQKHWVMNMDIDIHRIPHTPVKLVMKEKYEILGALWYGDHFIHKDNFTDQMKEIIKRHHAETLVERLKKEEEDGEEKKRL